MSFIIDPYRFGVVISPNDFPGLVRWYKADSYSLSDGDRVGGAGREWIDQSASLDNAVQATPANQPYYKANVFGSLPAIQFDPGDNSFLTFTNVVLAGAFTAIAITDVANATAMFGDSGSFKYIRVNTATVKIDYHDGANNMQSDVCSGAFVDPNMFSWRRDGAALFSFRERDIDRGDFLAGSLVSVTLNQIGGFLGGGGGNAGIGELCLWNTLLSSADIDNLFLHYFKNKWGIV